MLPAILIAMALIVVTGMVWELGRTYYPNLSITLVIPRPPDPPDFVWTQGGHHQNPMASYLPPIEVSFNCYFDPDVLPIKVPAGRVAYVFLLHKEVNASRHQVQFYEIPNFNGDVAKMWPDPHLVQEERQRSDQGVSALRCDVKNHGQQDILELTIPIDTLYDLDHNSGTWRTRLQNTIVINPLDRGDTFTFYVVNECPVETQTLIPHYAAANLVGERTQRRFQIELENPYAPSQGFGIGQSKVYWAGMSCP
ncbi:MAG TPA: hypothetical protein VG206_10160 [Terriglobia bacterium]|nr:hypothetical protein [Terriglobia bacterium]